MATEKRITSDNTIFFILLFLNTTERLQK